MSLAVVIWWLLLAGLVRPEWLAYSPRTALASIQEPEVPVGGIDLPSGSSWGPALA